MKAETLKEFTITFNQEDFSLVEHPSGGVTISSLRYALHYESDTETPALPLVSFIFPIEMDDVIEDYKMEKEEILISEDVILLPNPDLFPTSEFVYSSSQQPIHYDKASYPDNQIRSAETNKIGNNKYLSIIVSPFRYDSQSRKLYLASEMKIKISTNKNSQGEQQRYLPYGFYNMVDSDDYKYIIITNNTLTPLYQNLAKWKTRKGIRTLVVSVDDIYATYSDKPTNPQRIKTFLMDYFGYSDMALKYVLLGGDLNIVPTQLCHIWLYKKDTVATDTVGVYSDAYYASLKELNWDTNNDNLVADYSDSIDLSLDISVSRVPSSSTTETERYIKRILDYETYPKTSGWKNNILMAGRALDDTLFYVNNEPFSDTHLVSSEMYENYISPYWNCERKYLFDTGSNISGMNGFTTGNLQSALTQGFTFANVRTHGNVWLWVMDNGGYNHYNAQALVNTGNTIITTSACHTNDFEETNCLGKAFLTAENSGIMAYWGSSKEGWYYGDGHVGLSDEYIGNMYKSLLSYGYHRMGNAVTASKNELKSWTRINWIPYRWLHLSMNLLGDAEMPVYTSYPQRFNNVSISVTPSGDGVIVNPGTSGNITFCKSTDLVGYSDYYVRDYYSSVEFPNRPNDQCNICISMPNYIPYQAVYGKYVKLQNMEFDGDCHIHAVNNTKIGYNVTNILPVGNVVVKRGRTVIPRASGVEIQGGFEVKLGAEFVIE